MRAHLVFRAGLVLLLCLGIGSVVLAAGTAGLDRWAFSSGAGRAAGALVDIHQVIGQPLVGESSGEHVSLRAGYAVMEQQAPSYRAYLPLVVRSR